MDHIFKSNSNRSKEYSSQNMEIRISLKVLNQKKIILQQLPILSLKHILILLRHSDYTMICVLQITRIHNFFLVLHYILMIPAKMPDYALSRRLIPGLNKCCS
jgi:hypothetical protein